MYASVKEREREISGISCIIYRDSINASRHEAFRNLYIKKPSIIA